MLFDPVVRYSHAILKSAGWVNSMSNRKTELKYEKVYRKVRDMIAVRRFEPGFSLNVERLSRELGVSRGPVWEAMRRLEQEGVVKTIRNRGVFMAAISYKQMLEVVEVRGLMDARAARLACDRITKRQIERLNRCLLDQLRAIEAGDVSAYFLSDNTFHRTIYEASGHDYLKELFESITLRMLPVPRFIDILILPPHQPTVYMYHKDLIDSFINHDPEAAENAMMRHSDAILIYLKDKMLAETERKEMVRRMGKELMPSISTLKKRKRRLSGAKSLPDQDETALVPQTEIQGKSRK